MTAIFFAKALMGRTKSSNKEDLNSIEDIWRQIVELNQQAHNDPRLLEKLIKELKKLLLRLPKNQHLELRANLFNELGHAYYDLSVGSREDNIQKAIAWFRKALHYNNPDDAPLDYATIQNRLGNAYSDLLTGNREKNLQKAITCYHEAIKYRTFDETPIQYAATMLNLGISYSDLPTGNREKNLQKAITCYKEALRVYSPKIEPYRYAMTIRSLGAAYKHLPIGDRVENLRKSIDCYKESLRFFTMDLYPHDYAATQNNLGIVYVDFPIGNHAENCKKALDCYQEALRFIKSDSTPLDYALIQNNMGVAYFNILTENRSENLFQAIKCYREAIRFRVPESSPLDYAQTLNNLGNAYTSLITGDQGENLRQAIAYFQEALRFQTREASPFEFAQVQSNLGVAYLKLLVGDRYENLDLAMACFQKALTVYRPETNPFEYATMQNNLGTIYYELNFLDGEATHLYNAITSYQEALRFRHPDNCPLEYAQTQNNLGIAYADLLMGDRKENLRKAIACYREALRFRTPDIAPFDYARSQNNMGNAFSEWPNNNHAEDLCEAIICYREALKIFSPESFPVDCRQSATNLADLFITQENWRDGYEFYKVALRAAEILYRFAFHPDSQQIEVEENSTLFANMLSTCLHLIDDPVCCREGFVIAEAGKARLFLDQIGKVDYPSPPGIPQEVLVKEAQMLVQLRELERSLNLPNLLIEEMHTFAKQRKMIQENMEDFWGQMAITYPQSRDYLALRQGQSLTWEDLAELSKQLGQETALVEFFTLENEIAVFVLRSDWNAPRVFSLPVSQQRFFQRYFESYNKEVLCRTPSGFHKHDWQGLGAEILAPLLCALEGTRLIYFIPHGWLHLIPLHALTIEGEPFIARKAVAYAPSCAILARTLKRRNYSGQITSRLIVGYTPSEEDWERDIFLGEARDIASYFGTNPKLDNDATPQILEQLMGEARLIHFSCHGYYNGQDPLDSSVLLAGGEITARDWMSLRLQAELVTLSACQTGFNQVGPGDDISGLSRALLYAGVRSTLLTLWSVNAMTTREWMCSFYQKAWSHDGLPLISKAYAFQQAVLELREQYPDPYYWAPFILIGDAC